MGTQRRKWDELIEIDWKTGCRRAVITRRTKLRGDKWESDGRSEWNETKSKCNRHQRNWQRHWIRQRRCVSLALWPLCVFYLYLGYELVHHSQISVYISTETENNPIAAAFIQIQTEYNDEKHIFLIFYEKFGLAIYLFQFSGVQEMVNKCFLGCRRDKHVAVLPRYTTKSLKRSSIWLGMYGM